VRLFTILGEARFMTTDPKVFQSMVDGRQSMDASKRV